MAVAGETVRHDLPLHHPERDDLDAVFDGLISWAREHLSQDELNKMTKLLSDPDLRLGDLVLVDDVATPVREIHFRMPGKHQAPGVPSYRPAIEVVTPKGSQFPPLVPPPAPAR